VDLDGRVRTLAGSPERKGHRDGPAAEARFASPHGVAVAADGRIAVAEAENHTIRLLTPQRDPEPGAEVRYRVTTLAGVPGRSGFQDGPAAKALFSSPHAIQWRPDGSLLVADIGNARLRMILDDVVITVAGNGETGAVDGAAGAASFHYPMDLALDAQGGVLVADAGSHTIRHWMPGGDVSTLEIEGGIETPHGVAAAPDGVVVVAEMGRHRVLAIDSRGEARTLCGTGEAGLEAGSLNRPAAVLLHAGRLWVADLDNHRIQIAPWPLP
jgi:streptogramin lyase